MTRKHKVAARAGSPKVMRAGLPRPWGPNSYLLNPWGHEYCSSGSGSWDSCPSVFRRWDLHISGLGKQSIESKRIILVWRSNGIFPFAFGLMWELLPLSYFLFLPSRMVMSILCLSQHGIFASTHVDYTGSQLERNLPQDK